MNLLGKLVAAQAPLAAALVIVGALSVTTTSRLGDSSRLILADNYRSVLAAQRMKESLERIDSHALFILAGHGADADKSLESQRRTFEAELRVQEGNVTEPGEDATTRALRRGWSAYERELARYRASATAQERDERYFRFLQPAFVEVKRRADEILALNQDAMVRTSAHVERRARLFQETAVAAVLVALGLGLFASISLTRRILRPLAVVTAAVRRFGQGDLKARAQVEGGDEIAAVAEEVNEMAQRLERYRSSSLGELIQAQQRAQAAIDSLPDPIVILESNGDLGTANAAATNLLFIDPETAGEGAWRRVEPGVRAVVDRLRAHALGGKGAYVPRGFEDAVRVAETPDGERVFLPRATPTYDERGAVQGAAIVLQDATRLFRFDELKNDLVATVAHEFRTPLTSLRMALHLCTERVVGPLTEKQADLLFAARDDCERLQSIVDDLLNLSRLEAGHIDLHRRRCDPESLATAAVEIHRGAAEQAGVTLQAELPPGLPDVFADPERLQLVFTNLLSNAIRYTPSGATVTVKLRVVQPPFVEGDHRTVHPQKVRFEVTDRGPGIDAKHQSGLFEKFFRIPGSPEGGSGLGLFIAKGLVTAHGGEIGVESRPGAGATFWFTVPTAPPSLGSETEAHV